MFESTFQIVADNPVTIPPFLFAVWVGYRVLQANRAKALDATAGVAVVMIVPVFLLLFLAEFIGHSFFQETAESFIRFESLLIDLGFQFLDAVFAAWLRVVLLVLGGLWSVIQELVSSVVPVMESHEFLLTVFGFEFFAGAVLIYTLYLSSRGSDVDFWLTGGGAVLLVSGLLAGLVQLNTEQASESVLVSGFVAAMLGVALGVTATISLVRPNFGGASMVSDLRESELWSGKSDEDLRESRVVRALARLNRLFSR